VKQFDHFNIQAINRLTWDGTYEFSHRLPPGIYFVQLKAGDYQKSEKVEPLR
jgi:hypothetical protein